MHNLARMGEVVSVQFNGTPSSTLSNAITILTEDHVVRPLQPWERLSLDSLNAVVAGGTVTLLAALSGRSTATSTDVLATFSSTVGEYTIADNELNTPTGVVPSLLSSNGVATVVLVGTGHITNGQSQGKYPNWQAGTTPGQTSGRLF